jgi:translation initiation factor IF-2
VREVIVPDFITVGDLANRMAEKAADVIKRLMTLGMMATINQAIDADTAELVISEFGHKIKRVTEADIEADLMQKVTDNPEDLLPRAPVVTIMGHVDHGKTSLLDALRNTDVAAGEAGGITQHIGAYQVKLANNKMISFLDTPGHEAFTAMRMRGAKVTDIVVLVVAADDGIMQQTIEAISHARAAGVVIIVAINKIDKPSADTERVKMELLQHNVVSESMGGDIIIVEVSAKQKIGLEKLEEMILLQADMLELKANPNKPAEGAVIEAKVDKGKGVIATFLVQSGTLRAGDIVVAGSTWGKVRALMNDKSKMVEMAEPSMPIEVWGLESAPIAGDEFLVVPNEKSARDIVELRSERDKQLRHAASKPKSLDVMLKRALDKGIKELPVIIKGDVQGSVEAIAGSLQKLGTNEITVRVLHQAVGGITESDVALATASDAIILGFNVRANAQARDMAKIQGVEIKYYSVIYNLVDDIKAAMGGMLSPIRKENVIGYVEIRDVFDLSKSGRVAGCYVTEGVIKRSAHVRIIRDNVVIYDGKLKALRRFKDDVREVGTNFECGLTFENYDDIKVADKIEVYEVTEQARVL